MKIAIVLGSWTIGSLLLGLVLGRIFGAFAARRRAEQRLFSWVDHLRIAAAVQATKTDSNAVGRTADGLESSPVPKFVGAAWFSHWALHHGRRVQ